MYKKFLMFIVILLTAFFLNAEVSEKTILTSFTADKACYLGFSKKEVTNVIQLTPAESHVNGGELNLDVDLVNGYWYSELVYAYCQSFSKEGLECVVYAPQVMTAVYDNAIEEIPYELVKYDNYLWHSVSVNGITHNYYEIKEAGTDYKEPRVTMSLPLKIKVDSGNVKANRKYNVTFTLKVSAK